MKTDTLPFPIVPHEHPEDLINNRGVLYLVAMYILADESFHCISQDNERDEYTKPSYYQLEQELESWLDNAFDYLPDWAKTALLEVE